MNSPEPTIQSESSRVRIEISPGSSEYYIPNCNSTLKPYVGQKFHILEDGIQFYKDYAAECGFEIRRGPVKKSSDGTIIRRYIWCSREGRKKAKYNEIEADGEATKVKRRRVSNRVDCKACLVFKYSSCHGYVVDEFGEQHTHNMVSESYKPFMKVNRNLDFAHQNFILNCARANIGPMKSYRLFKETVGSYSEVGCNGVEFKNFARDLRAYVDGVDAQLLLDKLFCRREVCSAFTFDYSVDEHDKLTRLFWADPISRKNYWPFGQAVTFDATYSSNKYNLIFAPFTGKDNHDKCVTFGAGLLFREDVESYVWLFEKFKSCMGNAPTMLITDQDPAMKIAAERVFPETRHRLCMWHIMKKVPDKISSDLKNEGLFLKRFNDIVWSEFSEPTDFEKKWTDTINEFGLTEDSWFQTMFEICKRWIPAYFRDLPLSGLFRTTSASESVNSFFGKYNNPRDNLVHFFMHFESALDAQRHTHAQLSSVDESSFPELKTPLLFEKHAATIYTIKKIYEVQSDIYSGCHNCSIVNIRADEVVSVYGVDDGINAVFDVIFNKSDNTFTCGCKKFITAGLLCCHIFAVFKNLKIESIPEKYVVSRWTKNASSRFDNTFDSTMDDRSIRAEDNKHLMNQIEGTRAEVNQHLMKQVHSEFFKCVGLVDGNTENINIFLRGLRDLKEMFEGGQDKQSLESNKQKLFDRFYGSSLPNEVSVLSPDPVKTKGSGSRLKSRKEKAIKQRSKALRRCSRCKEMTNHDIRNCKKQL